MPGLALVCDPPTYTSHIVGLTGMYHHTQLYWLRWGLVNILTELASEHDPLNFCSSSSWDYRVSHQTYPQLNSWSQFVCCWL
jgi:hypothetical protein